MHRISFFFSTVLLFSCILFISNSMISRAILKHTHTLVSFSKASNNTRRSDSCYFDSLWKAHLWVFFQGALETILLLILIFQLYFFKNHICPTNLICWIVALLTGSTFNMSEIRLAASDDKCSGTWNRPPKIRKKVLNSQALQILSVSFTSKNG